MFRTSTKIELIFICCLLRWSDGINDRFPIVTNLIEFNCQSFAFISMLIELLVRRSEKYFPINENVVEVNVRDVPYSRYLSNHHLTNTNVSMLALEPNTMTTMTKEKETNRFNDDFSFSTNFIGFLMKLKRCCKNIRSIF